MGSKVPVVSKQVQLSRCLVTTHQTGCRFDSRRAVHRWNSLGLVVSSGGRNAPQAECGIGWSRYPTATTVTRKRKPFTQSVNVDIYFVWSISPQPTCLTLCTSDRNTSTPFTDDSSDWTNRRHAIPSRRHPPLTLVLGTCLTVINILCSRFSITENDYV